ncbi:unnamed protein product [Acanthoscelides obtectus]|uniref:Lipid storage droplets surface-binding protein 1 n=1 Tax=Acanthoscelides obtectus TaxID=200917 RepID=A0A9P0M628_ACAOB|nr:unnamed protein product [Acanthoscelides obtectus]CAK1623980.1 Lipid storage droplets surface-binding protein 1 [Acanthoscelides obtectus]
MVHHSRKKRPIRYLNRSSMMHSSGSTPQLPDQPNVIIKRYVSCETQTEASFRQQTSALRIGIFHHSTDVRTKVAPTTRKQFSLQELESVNRITNLPIVETGIGYAENVYNRIKKSNNLINWTLEQAENTAQSVFEVATPAIILFNRPISTIDKLVCKSLDVVEHTVPQINLPPQMIYWNTKQYVADVGTKIARPVLKRADSVRQISNSVLSSKYTAYAADTLDGALDVVEKYVDKYLPADDDKNVSYDEVDQSVGGPAGKAMHTVQHAKGFSRKLKRRLTQRTIAEVKALKQHSAEAVHVLIYVAELVATDPILAFQKGKELWASLSKDEPENQTRPENLEQLVVLLTRESARRMVHLINFSCTVLSTIPKTMSHSLSIVMSSLLQLTDSMIKTAHMENVQNSVVKVLRIQGRYLALVLKEANQKVNEYLGIIILSKEKQSKPKLPGIFDLQMEILNLKTKGLERSTQNMITVHQRLRHLM